MWLHYEELNKKTLQIREKNRQRKSGEKENAESKILKGVVQLPKPSIVDQIQHAKRTETTE